jgi:YtkA-like protein
MTGAGIGRSAALAAVALFACLAARAAEVRAKAEVECQPSPTRLQYDCTVKLANAATHEPLSGANVRIGADMPSMPMAHNVRPVPATAGQEAGTYRARVTLEMHGDWALRIDVAGPLRDRVVKVMRFGPGRVEPAPAGRAPANAPH